jgi:hypothetical protein
VAQNTRHCETVINDFVSFVNEHIQTMKVPPNAVVNIDETNVDYDMSPTSTLNRRGGRTVSVLGTGSSGRATVLLGVSLTGEKLPPFIVFAGKRSGRVIREVTGDVLARGFPAEVVMSVQAKAWMDEELMLEWIDRVWNPWIMTRNPNYSILIMDSFKVSNNVYSSLF